MSTEQAPELRVVALFDGRPGHEKQTMGIIQALQGRVPVQVIRINVKRFSFFDELIQTCRLYLPFCKSGLSHPEVAQGDLLIGTGTRTHLRMLLYKKKYAIPAITCMNPAVHLQNHFDLCFVPEHDHASARANIIRTVGSPNCCQNKKQHCKECGLILLGGVDSKSHHWDDRQVVQMVEKIVKTEGSLLWTVSSSPRTPKDTVSMVKQLLEKYENIEFFDYRDTPPGWIEDQYDKNRVVWVTADSISMVYEAISAGCTVGILPMHWLKENSKFKRNETVLLERRLVTSFTSWEQGKMIYGENIELKEAQRCADRILQQWWPEK